MGAEKDQNIATSTASSISEQQELRQLDTVQVSSFEKDHASRTQSPSTNVGSSSTQTPSNPPSHPTSSHPPEETLFRPRLPTIQQPSPTPPDLPPNSQPKNSPTMSSSNSSSSSSSSASGTTSTAGSSSGSGSGGYTQLPYAPFPYPMPANPRGSGSGNGK